MVPESRCLEGIWMKTNAPGKFSCEVYLKAWQLEIRDEYVMDHVDNCWWCAPIVHGDGEDFPLPIETEARQRLENRHRHRRRSFIKLVAASVMGLTAAGVGVGALVTGRSTATPAFTATPSSSVIDQVIEFDRMGIDRHYLEFGAPGIASLVTTGTEQESTRVIDWIIDRDHQTLFALVIGAVADPRPRIRVTALDRLTNKVDPVLLQPNVGTFQGFFTSETNVQIKDLIRNLIKRIKRFMISLTAPFTALAGSSVCVNVTGLTGTLVAKAELGGQPTHATVSQRPGGIGKITIKLPRTGSATLRIFASNGPNPPHVSTVVIVTTN